ncbi:permease-like cell division protein FtsX [Schleiferilactobacillus shenzhenensis]|uniref:Cell division protein FtsX n=1 Tax=Schleiferilactobacillus shenzhenensis LY-73 TaxID=1231336 RepID=U4TRW6_9LACO|nr:permease-like cell division protein FtsX [Schleiferilactobacillus shenzhenensis]ERL66195.1 FtsX [Schleiferilactobacillus shenzhenensis LY-73]
MKASTFKRHVTDSFRSLKRNGGMSVAAIVSVTVTLLLVGIFLALIFNVNHVSREVENDVRVRVMIDQKTTKAQRSTLADELKDMSAVSTVTYSSRQQELDKVVGSYGSAFRMFGGDSNPLNDVFIVKTKTPQATEKVAKAAQKLDHVADASYGGANARNLFKATDSLRQWGLGFSVLLLLVAVFLISNTVRITILSRRTEIGIMRLVGATNSYIRWPFLLEGAWTGLFGAILPIVIVDIGYAVIYGASANTFASAGYALLSPASLLVGMDFLLAIIGIVIGAVGAAISMGRFLKI